MSAAEEKVNYRQFVRDMRTLERMAKQDRLAAKDDNRTLELGAFNRALQKGKGITVREYNRNVRYTAAQLKAFDRRRRAATRQFDSTGTTIAAILAQMQPFPTFDRTSKKISSDLVRARNIPKPQFASARGDTLHFRVRAENPDPKRGISHHLTQVRLADFERSLRERPDPKTGYLPAVEKALSGGVKLHCDCGRWRYWYAYKASIAGYAIKPERGFPKWRNVKLHGTICKHLVVTLNFIRQSKVFASTLASRFERAAQSVFPDQRSESFVTQKEEKGLKKSRVDRKLRKVATAKKDFQQDRKRQRTEEERIRRAASKAARKAKRPKKTITPLDDPKKAYDEYQKAQRALQRQLRKEQKKREELEAQLKAKTQTEDQRLARQLIIALRNAGVDDATIAENPVIKASGLKLEDVS